MRTEVTRHIFDGGKLNIDGSEAPHDNVLTEGRSCKSFRLLLGIEDSTPVSGIGA